MALLAVLCIVQGIATVLQAYGLARALVEIWQLHSLHSLWWPMLIFATAFVIRQLCELAKKRIASHFADSVVQDLRPRVQEKIFRAGPSSMAQRGTGASVTMLLDGLDQTKTYIQTIMPKMLDMSFIPIVVLVVVWWQNWLAGVVLLVVLPLLLFFMALLGMAARDKANRQYDEFQLLNNRFVDTILGLPTLKMLGVSQDYEGEIYSVSERFRKRTMAVIMVAMSSSFALDFFTTLSIAVVAVFLGVNLINATVSLFPALFVLILAPEYFLPIRQFGSDYHATLNGKNALANISDVLDSPDPVHDDTFTCAPWNEHSALSLEHIDFAYERTQDAADNDDGKKHDDDAHIVASHEHALHDISMDVHGWESVAIVGASGSGKSTLIDLLAGFHIPQSGSIKLDGTSTNHLNMSAWQQHIWYIPQKPYIFHGSIADNIRFYTPQANEEQVLKAASQAGLNDWLATLPGGLHTAIGEGNRAISGGQAQRIALARVILDDSREILLFDEPTAHLDIETEYELKQALIPIMKRHLVIFATHRLHWLDSVDRVIVLAHGRIVQSGDVKELMKQPGPLQTLIGETAGEMVGDYSDR